MATRLSRRLVPLALLAGVLAAVPGPHDGALAAVPGKNGRIAFVRSAGAGPLEEVFMASPGAVPGPAVNLANDPLTSDTAPSWSPDGTRVALQRSGPADGVWVLEVAAGTMSLVPPHRGRVPAGLVARRGLDRLQPRQRR